MQEQITSLPLSDNERALWIDAQLHANFPGHALPLYFHFEPEPDPAQLFAAIARVIRRFPRLGMAVQEQGGALIFARSEHAIVSELTLADWPNPAQLQALCYAPFDLEHGPLLRWQRLQCGGQVRHLVCCHHLLGDQQSIAQIWVCLAQELGYMGATQPQALVIPPLPIGSPAVIPAARWRTALAQDAWAPCIPNQPPSGFAHATLTALTPAQTQAAQVSAKALELSLFELLLLAYAQALDEKFGLHARVLWLPALAHSHSQQYDVRTCGVLLEAGEHQACIRSQIRGRSAQPDAAFLSSGNQHGGNRHGVLYSRAPKGLPSALSGLASNIEGHRICFADTHCMVLHALPATPAAFSTCAQIYFWDDTLRLSIQVDQAQYTLSAADKVLQAWQTALARLITPESDAKPRNVKREPTTLSLPELLQAAANKYANHIALDDGKQQIRYRELEAFAAQARLQPSKGAIELQDDDSLLQVMRLYAGLRNGILLLTHAQLKPPEAAQTGMMFRSSGSSGAAKHLHLLPAAIASYGLSMVQALGLQPGDRVLRFASSQFDAVLEETLVSLLSGAALVCPVDDSGNSICTRRCTIPDFSALLSAHRITALNVATAWWRAAMAEAIALPASVRQVVIGGEAALSSVWQQFGARYPNVDLVNTYGLTEACVSQFVYRGAAPLQRAFVPIGQPLPHVAFTQVASELYIASDSLACNIAAERLHQIEGKNFLATGDLVEHDDATGALHFVARADRQIKLAGVRVDLDAIGATAAQLQGGAVVALVKDQQLWLAHTGAESAPLKAFAIAHHALLQRVVSIPLNVAGKSDLHSLAAALKGAPDDFTIFGSVTTSYIKSPQDGFSQLLLELVGGQWQHDWRLADFMSSLTWLRLRSQVQTRFGVSLEPADYRLTVAQLQAKIAGQLASQEAPVERKLHTGFFQSATQYPTKMALICGAQSWSYAALQAQVQALANALTQAGVGSGARVAFSAERTAFDVQAMLSISAVDAAFVPIALDRANSCANGSGALAERLRQAGVDYWLHAGHLKPIVEQVELGSKQLQSTAPVGTADGLTSIADLAYILFTSGSTGSPKAVAMQHQAALNTLDAVQAKVQLSPDDCLLALSPTQFDLSIFDVFATLAAGACLLWPTEAQRANPAQWPLLIQTHRASIWNSVPSSFSLLLGLGEAVSTLRMVLLSGDFVARSLIVAAHAALPQARIAVLGGATEAGIWSCWFDAEHIADLHFAPYGKALSGQLLALEDGQIVITGASVAAGYLETGHLQPFAGRYCTGDLGAALTDDYIAILGRMDQRVKWRGQRISVAPLEAKILKLPGVTSTAVVARSSALHAFVTLKAGVSVMQVQQEFTTRADALFAAGNLAAIDQNASDYCSPDYWHGIDALPLTANGKLDRIALQNLDAQQASAAIVQPHQIGDMAGYAARALWRQFLPHAQRFEQGDWFSQGGHSLLALKLVEAARAAGAKRASLGAFLAAPQFSTVRAWFSCDAADESVLSRDAHAEYASALENVTGAILVTGGTGMLAQSLIAALLQASDRTILVAVRASDKAAAEVRVHAHFANAPAARLIAVAADLSRPNFGWCDADFAAIGQVTTEIWHLGAEVNFLLDVHELMDANVYAADTAFKLAKLSGAQLHFTSSVGVFPYQLEVDVHESSSRPDGLFASGYAHSKWLAEQRLIALQAQAPEVLLHVYRLGLCAPPALRPLDIIGMSKNAIELTGCWPDLDTELNLLQHSDAISALMHLRNCNSDTRANAAPNIWHLQHPDPISLSALHSAIIPSAALVAPLDWLARLRASDAAQTQEPNRAAQLLARDMFLLLLQHAPLSTSKGKILADKTHAVLRAAGWRTVPILTVLKALMHA